MAESTTAPTNKYVAFKGRSQKEYGRRGLISETAMKKTKAKHSAFAKRAGHNPPLPEFGTAEVRDRYGNTYTLDPGYTPSRTSPLPAYRPDTRTAGAPRDIRTDAEKKRDKARAKKAADTKKADTDTVPLPRPKPAALSTEPTFATRAAPLPQRTAFTEPFGGEWQGGAGAPASLPAMPGGATPAYAAPAPATYTPAIANPPLPQPRPAFEAAPGGAYSGGYAPPMPSPVAPPGQGYGGGDVTMQPRFPMPAQNQQTMQNIFSILANMFNPYRAQ
jgi:hypothetical protein